MRDEGRSYWEEIGIRITLSLSLFLQREIDYAVGQVFRTLKKSSIYNKTFVFLTSDNGYDLKNNHVTTYCVTQLTT